MLSPAQSLPFISDESRRDLLAALEQQDPAYDEIGKLVWGKVYNTGYHSRLEPGCPVHLTRESAVYAAALLDSGEPWRVKRAREILGRLIHLQDQDPVNKTFGIWPWFAEESLKQMSPPDWNWADFIGVQVIQALWRNQAALGPELVRRTKEVLHYAAQSIKQRNVSLDYTNIVIMGTYVTVMAGEILVDAALSEYGKDRLRRFHAFTLKWDNFPEFNSPTYTVVALTELTRMFRDFPDVEDRALVEELLDIAWREVATHWHASSREWAGPHSRSYSTKLTSELRGVLQRGMGTRARIMEGPPEPALQESLLPFFCPDRYVDHFRETAVTRDQLQPIESRRPSLMAITHLAPSFSLGSVTAGSFWNQRRSLVGYVPDRESAAAFRVQFLHDGYDFGAAYLLASQRGGRVLGGVNFASDGGDNHPYFDRLKDGHLEASDLRLRFEFLGADRAGFPKVFNPGVAMRIPIGRGMEVWVGVLEVHFGGHAPFFKVTAEPDFMAFDVVFYHGEKRAFHLNHSLEAWLTFVLAVQQQGMKAPALPQVWPNADPMRRHLTWQDAEGKPFALKVPRYPATEEEILYFRRNEPL